MRKYLNSLDFDIALAFYGGVVAIINLLLIFMTVIVGDQVSRTTLILTIIGAALFVGPAISLCISVNKEDLSE